MNDCQTKLHIIDEIMKVKLKSEVINKKGALKAINYETIIYLELINAINNVGCDLWI